MSTTITTPKRTRSVRAALLMLGGVAAGCLVAARPVAAATESTGYGYGYGYGYGAASNLLKTALNTQTIVAAVPAGALLAGAVLWERRASRRSSLLDG